MLYQKSFVKLNTKQTIAMARMNPRGVLSGEVRHYRDNAGLECDAEVHLEDGQYNGLGKQYGQDGQIIYEGKFLCGKPEEEFKKSPGYSDYLKKEEERKAQEAAKALEAKKKADDEKNGKIGCAIIIIIVIILANIL